MTDQHNPYVAGFAGDPYVQTPTLDELAESGVVFTSAYTPDPICVPARQAFHSGRMSSNLNIINSNYEAMGTFFTRMGYDTAWYGKQHWETMVNTWQDIGYDSGKRSKQMLKDAGLTAPADSRLVTDAFVYPYDKQFNTDTITTNQAVEFLDTYAGDTPFFLGVSFVKPHFPYTIQQEFYDMYVSAGIPLPPATPEMINDLSAALKSDRLKFGIDQLTPQQNEFCRAIYYGMVTYVDQQFQRILDRLDQLGLRDDTIVIYTSDHGDLIGQHGMWYKNSFFEGSARVPMIISLPRSFDVSGVSIDAPVNTLDLYPTLCELLGLTPPTTLEGHSLVPLIDGSDTGESRVAFSENKRLGVAARMVRTNEYKYCYYEDGFEQLYDITTDRDTETTNLATDPAYNKIRKTLKAMALLDWNPKGLKDSGD